MSISIESNQDGVSGAVQVNGINVLPFNSGGITSKIQSINATVASNTLTLELGSCILDFRNPTLTNGVANTRIINTPLTLVVPQGATLGSVNGVLFRLYIIALDVSGVQELAVVNAKAGTNMDETNLISTTAISGSSTSADIVYSTTARTSVPYRVVGFIQGTQATAGTYVTDFSTKQGVGGAALGSLGTFGNGQKYRDMTASRAIATPYTTTDKGIWVMIDGNNTTAQSISNFTVGTVSMLSTECFTAGGFSHMFFYVPPWTIYRIDQSNGSFSISQWIECS